MISAGEFRNGVTFDMDGKVMQVVEFQHVKPGKGAAYNDGALYYFMDQETYELEPIDASALDDSFKFVKENDVCTIMSYKGKVFGVEVPNFADLVVTKTEPGFAGNTATNVTKPATVETGAEVKVPLFINEGDKIQIDTRTGEYMGRAK